MARDKLETERAKERLRHPATVAPPSSDQTEPEARLPGIGERPLIELIPNLPGLRGDETNKTPHHLGWLLDTIDEIIEPRDTPDKFCRWISVPPGHWKTTTICFGIIKHLARWPRDGVAYITHTADIAEKHSRDIRRVCGLLGWKTRDDINRAAEWELKTGGGLLARGVSRIQAGRRFRWIIIDDPFRNREQANSPTERQKIYDAIEEDALPRLLPGGAILLNHTRWHPDDTIGRYRKEGWEGRNIQAIRGLGEAPDYEGGEALLPEVESLGSLRKILVKNPHKFFALYQGEPRPRGDTLFNPDPQKYHWGDQPKEGAYAYGVDLAYSEKGQARADFSVCLRMLKVVDPSKPTDDKLWKYYIVNVIRKQVQAPSFLLAMTAAYNEKKARMLWTLSGTEKGSLQFIKQKLPVLEYEQAIGDPYQRAQALAEAWNEGRVLVPMQDEDAPDWVDDFTDELTNFTGVKDPHDDQVVAAASAFKLLSKPAPVKSGGGLTTYQSPMDY